MKAAGAASNGGEHGVTVRDGFVAGDADDTVDSARGANDGGWHGTSIIKQSEPFSVHGKSLCHGARQLDGVYTISQKSTEHSASNMPASKLEVGFLHFEDPLCTEFCVPSSAIIQSITFVSWMEVAERIQSSHSCVAL